MAIKAKDIAKKHGMMSEGEVLLLQDVAQKLPPSPTVINIGAGTGTSVCSILEVRPDAFIVSVDNKAEPREAQSLKETDLIKLNRCFRLLTKSQALWNWPWQVDLVFVDGAHDDDSVSVDIDVFFPKVKDGGFILFHDYDHKLPGLTAIVDDRMAKQERVGKSRFLVAFRKTS